MDSDEIVTKQLTSRLKRVQKRIAELTAEAEMIDRMLATAARGEAKATLKLRKNSVSKWSVQGQTRRYLADHEGPVRAYAIHTSPAVRSLVKIIDLSIASETYGRWERHQARRFTRTLSACGEAE